MSDTPRTDAASHNMGSVLEPHYVVDVEVARNLERELAEALTGFRVFANAIEAKLREKNT